VREWTELNWLRIGFIEPNDEPSAADPQSASQNGYCLDFQPKFYTHSSCAYISKAV
jgi:hypothetical protein